MSDEYSKYSMKVGLNAFTNPTTNSYKRLIPGFEAPVMLAYSARNRTASIRIPHTSTMNSKRIEARFPDAAANPYFAFAAMLMAGLDGIENKIHPSDPHEGNLYDPKISHGIPQVASSLDQALSALDQDRNFLKKVAFLRMILSMILLSLRKKKFTPLTIRRNQLNLKCIMVCRLCEARRK